MKTIRIFTFFIFLFWQCPVISAQNTVNIIPLIHSAIIETGSDVINNERHVIEILKELPCNFDADTVFAIEYFSYIGNFLYLMYWSQKFRYSVEGPMDDTLKVYRERRFEKWLIEQVEEWNKDSIMGAQCGVYGPDETHYVIRIIFHSGKSKWIHLVLAILKHLLTIKMMSICGNIGLIMNKKNRSLHINARPSGCSHRRPRPTRRMFHTVPLVWSYNPDPLNIRIFNPTGSNVLSLNSACGNKTTTSPLSF